MRCCSHTARHFTCCLSLPVESARQTEKLCTAVLWSTASLTGTVNHYAHLLQACGTWAATVALVWTWSSIVNHMPFVTLRLYLLSEMSCLCVVDISELGFAHWQQVCFDCLSSSGCAALYFLIYLLLFCCFSFCYLFCLFLFCCLFCLSFCF